MRWCLKNALYGAWHMLGTKERVLTPDSTTSMRRKVFGGSDFLFLLCAGCTSKGLRRSFPISQLSRWMLTLCSVLGVGVGGLLLLLALLSEEVPTSKVPAEQIVL